MNSTLEAKLHEWQARCDSGDVSMLPALQEQLRRDFHEVYQAGKAATLLTIADRVGEQIDRTEKARNL